MGEPFRDAHDNAAAWFAQADTDHDGRLTLAEFRADAMRFFAQLDVDQDREIGPEEIERYEREVAPETGSGGAFGATGAAPGARRAGRGGHRGGGGMGGRPPGGGMGGGRSGREEGGPADGAGGGHPNAPAFDPTKQGAARFSYLALPEPVIAADADFNRGVSRQEFLQAASRRFALLDPNHDGIITPDELPKLGGEIRCRMAVSPGRHSPTTDRALRFLVGETDGKCTIVSKAILSLSALIGAASSSMAQTAPAPPVTQPANTALHTGEGRLFISPMGEPFRDAPDNAEAWFAQADADHDGKITLAEFRADAMRFFAKLDTDRDHEIGPEEIEHYEQVIAPETGITGGGPIDDNFGVSQPSGGPPPEGESGAENQKAKFDPAGQGATAYSYLALPEPVIAADTDFNRGVSQREFLLAAARRFALLDTNHDGVITREELPKLRGGEMRSERGSRRGSKSPRQ